MSRMESTCPTCGARGWEAGTLGHQLACMRACAAELNAGDLVSRADMIRDRVDLARDTALGLPDMIDEELTAMAPDGKDAEERRRRLEELLEQKAPRCPHGVRFGRPLQHPHAGPVATCACCRSSYGYLRDEHAEVCRECR